MRLASIVSHNPVFKNAAREVVTEAQSFLKGKQPDVAFLFVSAHHSPCYYFVPKEIQEPLNPKVLIGCSAGSIIANSTEFENRPGIALMVGFMPGVKITPFSIQESDCPNMDAPPDKWVSTVGVSPKDVGSMIIYSDPLSINVQNILSGFDFAYRDAFKSGALASGGTQEGGNALFINDQVKRSGLIGLTLSTDVNANAKITQACRPIGDPMIVTRARNNVIYGVGENTPLNVLGDLFETLDEYSRSLMSNNLAVGIAANQLLGEHFPGDFLIRNITAVSELEGSISVGENIQEGQLIQFQLIDPKVGREDLKFVTDDINVGKHSKLAGAFLHPCLSRGKNMFEEEGFEAQVFSRALKDTPLIGFFSNGQISTVNGSTRLLGYSSVLVTLSPSSKKGLLSALKNRHESQSPPFSF